MNIKKIENPEKFIKTYTELHRKQLDNLIENGLCNKILICEDCIFHKNNSSNDVMCSKKGNLKGKYWDDRTEEYWIKYFSNLKEQLNIFFKIEGAKN